MASGGTTAEAAVVRLEQEMAQMRLALEQLLQERGQWQAAAAAAAQAPPDPARRRVALLDCKVSPKPLVFDSSEAGFVDFAFRLETVLVNAFGRGARVCLQQCTFSCKHFNEKKFITRVNV